MFEDVVVCSEVLRRTARCCGVFEDVVVCSEVLRRTARYCGVFENVVVCSEVPWCVRRCCEVPLRFLGTSAWEAPRLYHGGHIKDTVCCSSHFSCLKDGKFNESNE